MKRKMGRGDSWRREEKIQHEKAVKREERLMMMMMMRGRREE